MRLPPSDPELGMPNMMPLIDLVFVLLIFFLMASRFEQEERELPVELPEVVQAAPLTMTPELIVNVMRDGSYKVAGKEYAAKELAALLVEASRRNPDQSVLIRGDNRSSWESGVRVMDLCNRASIKRYKVAALERSQQP